MYTRAFVFLLLLTLSAALFPLLGLGLEVLWPSFIGDFLLFWPLFMLVPNGFVSQRAETFQFGMMDCSIYCALLFWLACALLLGYLLRNVKISHVAMATYPIAAVVMIAAHSTLWFFGYKAFLLGI